MGDVVSPLLPVFSVCLLKICHGSFFRIGTAISKCFFKSKMKLMVLEFCYSVHLLLKEHGSIAYILNHFIVMLSAPAISQCVNIFQFIPLHAFVSALSNKFSDKKGIMRDEGTDYFHISRDQNNSQAFARYFPAL